jgi:hypothetical protein
MNKEVNKGKREKKIVKFTGKIIESKEEREYKKDGNHETYFCLTVKTEEEKREVIVLQRKVSKSIWDQVNNDSYIDRRYLFSCEKVRKIFHLSNWREIN